ncbi:MAG: Curved DNA-binding protein (42 kDa protein) [Vezdaea aestivalis]|nr:MAG: Curved DNA-binding protein (42 kDa protein) [Vezdaea aestivalis]
MADEKAAVDYTLNNPDTLTKYKTAGEISHKVLASVTTWCKAGETYLSLCERGDKLLEEEISKVFKGKKIAKGIGHPTTVSPSPFITPYTPLTSDAKEAALKIEEGDVLKIQLGAHIDGFGTIVCDTLIVGSGGKDDEPSQEDCDLLLATYWAQELLLRLVLPPGLLTAGTEEEKKKAQAVKPFSQTKISSLIQKVVESYGCSIVEDTTCWLFERNEIEGKKKIILSPSEGAKGDGIPETGEVWGLEIGVSAGSGKVKNLENRPTLHRRTTTTYGLKRQSSRQILSEVVKKFGTFPFSLRQLEDEKSAKVGVVECVRGGVIRQYEVVGDKNDDDVARVFSTVAITKNGLTKLAAPPPLDLDKIKSEKKITDEEVLKILELQITNSSGKSKSKKKKKKAKAKTEKATEEDEESSDEDSRSGMEPPASVQDARATRRSSRRSSPHGNASKASPVPISEKKISYPKKGSVLDWFQPFQEPPLAAPTPSYMDHKGLERTSVLENMQALGTFPSVKAKAKGKHEPLLKRLILSTKGGVLTTREEAGALPTEKIPSPKKAEALRSPIVQLSPQTPKMVSRSGSETQKSPSKASGTIADPPGRALTGEQRLYKQVCEHAMKGGSKKMGEFELEIFRQVFYDTYERQDLVRDFTIALEASAGAPINAHLAHHFRHWYRKARNTVTKSRPLAQPKHSTERSTSKPDRSAGAMTTRFGAIRAAEASGSPDSRERPRTARKPTTNATKSIHQQSTSRSAPPSVVKDENSELLGVEGLMANPTLRRNLRSKSNSSAASTLTSIESSEIEELHGPSGAAAAAAAKSYSTAQSSSSLPASTTEGDGPPILATSTRTRTRPPAAASSSEPIKAAMPALPPLHTFMLSSPKSPVGSSKRKAAAASLSPEDQDPEEAAFEAKRQKLTRSFDDEPIQYPQSAVRDEPRSAHVTPQPAARSTRASLARASKRGLELDRSSQTPIILTNGRAGRDEDAESLSPAMDVDTPRDLTILTPPAAPETPTALGRIAKRAKKAPRVKTSPMKKKTGVIAGTSRVVRDVRVRESPTEAEEDENNDYCSACSGTGQLLCCDGCDRSFHMTCIEPPLEAETLPDEWFCYACMTKKGIQPSPGSGLLSSLCQRIQKENPAAYELPVQVRRFFEGVKTGDEGEYEEAALQRPKTRAGYEEVPDNLKLKDNKGKAVLCYKCGKSSLNQSEITSCDHCQLHWHLDCLDPPLASVPVRSSNGRTKLWMCPNHINKELMTIDPHVRDRTSSNTPLDVGDRTYRVRRPKHAKITQPSISRGVRNNGLIEIINDEDGAPDNFYEQSEYGQIYRLPEKSIKLDFTNKINRLREEQAHADVYAKWVSQARQAEMAREFEKIKAKARAEAQAAAPAIIIEEQYKLAQDNARIKASYLQRSEMERKVVASLVSFAKSRPADESPGSESIEGLVGALIAEASPEVKAMMDPTPTNATNGTGNDVPLSPPSSDSRPEGNDGIVTDKEKHMLQLLQSLINKRLEQATPAAALSQ